MAAETEPKISPPGEGPVYSVVGDVYTFKMTGAETGGAYALIDCRIPPDGGPPPHIHRREDEDFFIIEGELTFYVEGKEVKAPPGTYIHVPKNIPHSFKNMSSKNVWALCWVRPAGMENYFAEVGTRLLNSSAAPAPVTPADIEKLLAAAPKYGLEILPPPH